MNYLSLFFSVKFPRYIPMALDVLGVMLVFGGYQYVEGVAIQIASGQKISHAWNIDSQGNHVDFTLINTGDYLYKGIIIPTNLLTTVGCKNGGIWYCCLPYLGVE